MVRLLVPETSWTLGSDQSVVSFHWLLSDSWPSTLMEWMFGGAVPDRLMVSLEVLALLVEMVKGVLVTVEVMKLRAVASRAVNQLV